MYSYHLGSPAASSFIHQGSYTPYFEGTHDPLKDRATLTLLENKKMLLQTDRTLAQSKQMWGDQMKTDYVPFDVFKMQLSANKSKEYQQTSHNSLNPQNAHQHSGDCYEPRHLSARTADTERSQRRTSSYHSPKESQKQTQGSQEHSTSSEEKKQEESPKEKSPRTESTSPVKQVYDQKVKILGFNYQQKSLSSEIKTVSEIQNSALPEISKVPEMSPQRKRRHRSASRNRAFAEREFSNNSPIHHNFEEEECDNGSSNTRDPDVEPSFSDISLSVSDPPSLTRYMPQRGTICQPKQEKTPPRDWFQKYTHRKGKYQRAFSRMQPGHKASKCADKSKEQSKSATVRDTAEDDLEDQIQKVKCRWFNYRREFQHIFTDGNNMTCNALVPEMGNIRMSSHNLARHLSSGEEGVSTSEPIRFTVTSSAPNVQITS